MTSQTLANANTPDTPHATAAAQTPPTPLAGAVILAIFVVAAAGYIYLNTVLGMTDFWAGFLFLTYWMAAEQVKPGAFVSSAIGAVIGILLALALQILPHVYGGIGQAAAIGLILVAIYMQIVGWAKIAINFSTMIFLTAGAAVPIQAHVDLIAALEALILGIAFFGAFVIGGQKIAARFAAPATAT